MPSGSYAIGTAHSPEVLGFRHSPFCFFSKYHTVYNMYLMPPGISRSWTLDRSHVLLQTLPVYTSTDILLVDSKLTSEAQILEVVTRRTQSSVTFPQHSNNFSQYSLQYSAISLLYLTSYRYLLNIPCAIDGVGLGALIRAIPERRDN